jgi:ArsR family transcriptional regulator
MALHRGKSTTLHPSIDFDTMFVDMTALDLQTCCRPLGAAALDDDEVAATATLFKALGDPARVRIVNLLATRDEAVCACDFEPALGLSQATVSHHLRKLTDAGLLEREQRGKWAYFSINEAALDRVAALVQLPEENR